MRSAEPSTRLPAPLWRDLLCVLLSAAMAFLYARGGVAYLLGFVLLVPWLHALTRHAGFKRHLWLAYALCLAYTAAVFPWFAHAISSYTENGVFLGWVVLFVTAPLLQPQFFAFVIVRFITRKMGWAKLAIFSGSAAWLAAEWLMPKLLGDTLGHGLYPSVTLRQAADLGGAPGLTLMLLLVNEAVTLVLAARKHGLRSFLKPLCFALVLPLLVAIYGLFSLQATPEERLKRESSRAEKSNALRVALVQANITDYEQQREEKGTHAVVREVLDTHFAMSYDAVVRQHADVVMWTETAYPTTFGHPKSEAGAELDSEILSNMRAAGVPFIFGTYDRDDGGEYNAAAFVMPETGLLGFYRKTRLFLFTEYVPSWLDSPTLRRYLPWTGSWQKGSGARVLPLRLADGREIPVMALICLDDVDSNLAIDGARLGAQAIFTMSNDAWFTHHPQGAALHQTVAAFRSIETRLPQFRVTTNGFSGVIDPNGNVLAGARMGERTLVIATLPVGAAPVTLMLLWGDWVGRAAAGFLLCLFLLAGFNAWRLRHPESAELVAPAVAFPIRVAVLTPAARFVAGALRFFSRGSLLVIGAVILFDEALRTNTFAQIRIFSGFFLLPELASWCVLLAFGARATIEKGSLAFTRGQQRFALPLSDIAVVELWRLSLPSMGSALRLVSGKPWHYGLVVENPNTFAHAIVKAGAEIGQNIEVAPAENLASRYQLARCAIRRGRLDSPWFKFLLLPLALAIPAFQLHQHIAYGSAFGEYSTFGLKAFLLAFGIWWAAWTIGVTCTAAALRAAIETGTLLLVLARRANVIEVRRWLERFGHLALYLGLPVWLVVQVVGI
ncbi:MAG: apolipoprotein N-acyltransferase [Burkholderiaceae bacterium]|nr:apolipoprotein N-acyltransferase [Burkholderiaceae bacterium]